GARVFRWQNPPRGGPLRAGGARLSHQPRRLRGGSGSWLVGAENRARETGWAAVALPRDLVASVGDDSDTRALHSPSRLRIALEGERSARSEREDVRALGLELLVPPRDDA